MNSTNAYRLLQRQVQFEIARLTWNGELERKIENLPAKFDALSTPLEQTLLKGYIALSLGQAAGSETSLSRLAQQALAPDQPTGNVIDVITEACQYCSGKPCSQGCNQGPIKCGAEKDGQSEDCLSCGSCIPTCPLNAISDKAEFVPLLKLMRNREHPVVAIIAPAFAGQFGPLVTLGQLRAALQHLGFLDLVEVALFADILTIKETFEYVQAVQKQDDYMITSCCCPSWIKLIENRFPNLLQHVAPSVSPMIAAGRVIKELRPGVKIVFIGPCIAKKTEAKQPDLSGAVDYVLTFKELEVIFAATGLNPAAFPAGTNPQASWGGRAYGRTGGVAASMQKTLQALQPAREVEFIATSLDGIKDCQEALLKLSTKEFIGNFIEGMACLGGCVGGPGRLIDPEQGTEYVNRFSEESSYSNPLDNPQVSSILAQLGKSPAPKYIAGWNVLKRELLQ